MKKLTSEQVNLFLNLNTLPTVSYVGISTHKSGNIYMSARLEIDSSLEEITYALAGIFGVCEYKKQSLMQRELETYCLDCDGVEIDLSARKTKEVDPALTESTEEITLLNNITDWDIEEVLRREAI